jgi:hypothetical protein
MSGDELKPVAKPIDWDELYDGKFLKAGELKGQRVTLTIKSVDIYELEGKKGPERRGVISFDERPKLIALNKINGLCLRAMFGRLLAKWEGKRITIFPDVVKEAGAMQGDPCIRIWGSPELSNDLDVVIQLRKRKPYTMTMHKIGGAAERKPPPPTAREPGDD